MIKQSHQRKEGDKGTSCGDMVALGGVSRQLPARLMCSRHFMYLLHLNRIIPSFLYRIHPFQTAFVVLSA